MKKSTKYELPHDKPLLTVTVGEFAALMAAILNERKAVQDTGTMARGLGELADRLGCGRSKVSELRRLGVLTGPSSPMWAARPYLTSRRQCVLCRNTK